MAETFHKGDTVVCVDAKGMTYRLTEGKTYVLELGEHRGYVGLVSDRGRKTAAKASRFVSVGEYAAQTLANKLAKALDDARTPAKPTRKLPKSITVSASDVNAALTRMLREEFGIEATVTEIRKAMETSIELRLK